jgi:hypothetical protein
VGPSDVNQSDSIVGGDQVARDKVTNITYTIPPSDNPFLIRELVEAVKRDAADDAELGKTIDELQHFLDSVDAPDLVGLAAKLTLAERTDEIREAEQLKELFAKKLHRRQFSPSAQFLFAYLLGEMNQRFKYKIRPLITNKAPRRDVDRSVYEEVLKPIEAIINRESLVLLPQEIQGMLYFLTGNCHISWH